MTSSRLQITSFGPVAGAGLTAGPAAPSFPELPLTASANTGAARLIAIAAATQNRKANIAVTSPSCRAGRRLAADPMFGNRPVAAWQGRRAVWPSAGYAAEADRRSTGAWRGGIDEEINSDIKALPQRSANRRRKDFASVGRALGVERARCEMSSAKEELEALWAAVFAEPPVVDAEPELLAALILRCSGPVPDYERLRRLEINRRDDKSAPRDP